MLTPLGSSDVVPQTLLPLLRKLTCQCVAFLEALSTEYDAPV